MSPDAKIVIAGVEEADRLNLEAFIEATDLGKVTYEACGFVYAGSNYLETAKRNASQKWRELERFMEYVLKFIFSFRMPDNSVSLFACRRHSRIVDDCNDVQTPSCSRRTLLSTL